MLMNGQTTSDTDNFHDLLKNRVSEYSPDEELLCSPRWLFFHSSTDYKNPLCTRFTITNTDQFSVAWCIKAKEKIMRLSQGHGLLKPGEKQELTVGKQSKQITLKLIKMTQTIYFQLYIISSDDWPRDSSEYTMKRIKLVVESLRIPEYIQSKNKIVRLN
uniref:MSP domain-containing protein n=1 Tax=Heterorhabditis bacteriophora TaxID=37862 RepID=A0A1I7WPD2_HETBA